MTSQIYSKSNNIRIAPVLQYLFSKTGPLATTGCDHGAFVSTTGARCMGRSCACMPAMAHLAALAPLVLVLVVLHGNMATWCWRQCSIESESWWC